MGTIYKAIIIFVLVFIFTMPSIVCQAQETDAGCVRKYFMGKCENLALPDDWKERSLDYYDCLSEQIAIDLERCKHLLPDYGRKFSITTEEAMFSTIRTNIPSILHHDRFVMVQPSNAIPSTIEYFFEATYDCARDPVIREGEDQHGNPDEDELWPSYLNLRMYFNGEEKELVKEWTSACTSYYWECHMNKMFNNRELSLGHELSLLRKEVPITNLLDEFEKKPVTCQIKPEKDEVGKGEEIEIILSDFRDGEQRASREFNRIVVRANEGKILNGETSVAGPEYKVFCLNEQPVRIRYEGPKNSEAGSDRIIVYNSCEILPPDKSPLRTTNPDKQIAYHELRLEHQGWSGTINLTITQTYNCDVEEQVSALSYQRTIAGDHKSTQANITLGMTDFDFPKQGTSAGAKLQYISGQVTFNMREEHTTEGNAQKTQCHNDGTGKWEWVSPGSWGTTHETMAGQAYCDIEDGGLTLLIVKEMLGDKKAMDNMQQEMAKLQAKMREAAALAESAAIETYKAEMLKLVQGDPGSSSIPIKVAINIFTGSINYPVYATYERKAFDVCSGDFDENESRSETLEMPLALPLGAEMKGLYTRDDNGNDRIEASINDSQPYYITFGSGICPEGIMTITGNITLERNKE